MRAIVSKTRPMLSVLLPVYNARDTVGPAIQSILRQTFREFELLVIDDGSQDGSVEIARKFRDPRIRIIELKENGGLVAALNLGIELARGDLIARQDADDESMPTRLERQFAVLSREPNLVAVGAALQIVKHGSPSGEVWKYPVSAAGARWLSLFKTPVAHSAVVYRRAAVIGIGGYSEDYRFAEDFELWSRLLEIGNIISLKEILVKYDIGVGGVSRAKVTEQRLVHCRIVRTNMQRLLGRDVENDVAELLAIQIESGGVKKNFSEYQKAVGLLACLYGRFVAAEQTGHRDTAAREVRTDMEDRVCKMVRMLPYRLRLRGLSVMLGVMPNRSISPRSIVRMLCLP